RDERDDEQPPVPPLGGAALAHERLYGAPAEHGIHEHVVVDLVACRTGGGPVDRAQNPFVPERVEDGQEVGLTDCRVRGEVCSAMGDLRSGRRHEVVEDAGRDVALLAGERIESPFEMRANDRRGAAETVEGREAEQTRALSALRLPEPLHDELKERRLDPYLAGLQPR